MTTVSHEIIRAIAEIRREAEQDLTDLVFLLGIASEKLKVVGEKFNYLGAEFTDLSTAIRLAKQSAEQSQNYHNSEAYQLENDVKKALEKLQATGPLLNEQERDSNG